MTVTPTCQESDSHPGRRRQALDDQPGDCQQDHTRQNHGRAVGSASDPDEAETQHGRPEVCGKRRSGRSEDANVECDLKQRTS